MKRTFPFLAILLILTLLCSSLTSCVFFVKDFAEGVADGMQGGLPKADEPYSIEYVSNGNGTCKAVVTMHPLYREEFELIIPDNSPEGDTVTEVDFAQYFKDVSAAFPTVITSEGFTKLTETMAANLEGGTNNRAYVRVVSCYISYNVETMKEIIVNAALEDYPFLEYTKSAHFFDEYADISYFTMVRKYIEEYADVNAMEFAYDEYKKIADALTDSGIPESELDEYIPEYNRYEEAPTCLYMTSVTLPKGLTKLHKDDLDNFAVCGYVYKEQSNGVKNLSAQNFIVVPEGAGSDVLNPLLKSDVEKIFLLGSEIPEYEKSDNEYENDTNAERIFTYSETYKKNGWYYTDGIPTEW